MKQLQVQGVHHITLVGSTKQSAIDFWQGALGMPFIFEQPNLGKPDENHLYFDPGDGRLLTVDSNIELISSNGRRLCLESTRDVTEHKQWRQRQQLLLDELSHRVGNEFMAIISPVCTSMMMPTAALARNSFIAVASSSRSAYCTRRSIDRAKGALSLALLIPWSR